MSRSCTTLRMHVHPNKYWRKKIFIIDLILERRTISDIINYYHIVKKEHCDYATCSLYVRYSHILSFHLCHAVYSMHVVNLSVECTVLYVCSCVCSAHCVSTQRTFKCTQRRHSVGIFSNNEWAATIRMGQSTALVVNLSLSHAKNTKLCCVSYHSRHVTSSVNTNEKLTRARTECKDRNEFKYAVWCVVMICVYIFRFLDCIPRLRMFDDLMACVNAQWNRQIIIIRKRAYTIE